MVLVLQEGEKFQVEWIPSCLDVYPQLLPSVLGCVCEDVLQMPGALLSWFLVGEMHILHPPQLCLPEYDQQLSSQELFIEVLDSFQGVRVCLVDLSRRISQLQ